MKPSTAKTHSKKIDFEAINAVARSRFESLIRQWLPNGKKSGAEYVALNPTRSDGHAGSFSINVNTGVWEDFATGDSGGDPVSLYAYLFHNNNQGDAAKALAEQFGLSERLPAGSARGKPAIKPKAGKVSPWQPLTPPADAPPPPKAHVKRGLPEQMWCYRGDAGNVLGYVYRFKTSDGGKEVLPLSWCKHLETGLEEWRWMAFAQPRWLYGLDRLGAKPDAPVLIVEGEKCADAAAGQLPNMACVTWPGGGKAVDKIDWSPLAGRDVIIWPDCDAQRDKAGVLLPQEKQPGLMAAVKIAYILTNLLPKNGGRLWILTIPHPGEKKSGWDVVDAIDEGLTGEALSQYLHDNCKLMAEAHLGKVADKNSAATPVSTAISRQLFEDELNAAGADVDAILRICSTLQLSPLHPAEIELLLKRAAKALGVTVLSLKKNRQRAPPDGGVTDVYEDFVDELNARHAIVPIAGRVLVMNQEWDPALMRNMVTFSSSQDLQLRYFNQKTWGKSNGKPCDIASAWLEHPLRRQYEGVVFAPHKDTPDYFNLFQGFGIEARTGNCTYFKKFVFEVICSEVQELFDYLWNWLGHLFQKPDELPGTAFVLRGKQGVGKNTFVEAIGILVGTAHYIQLSNILQVTGRFSGHLADCLLVFANEAIWGGDKTAEGALKHMVTDPITAIERKGRDIIAMNNYKRLIAASNEDWVIPRGLDDRRFIIADVSDEWKENHPYFARIKKELVNGGYQALMAEFMALDLTNFEPRSVPEHLKEVGWELKIRSGGSILQWWHSVLANGYLWELLNYAEEFQCRWPEKPVICTDVYDHYLGFCKKLNVMHPELDCVVGKKLKTFGLKKIRSREKGMKNCYKFLSLEECRKSFSTICSIPMAEWEFFEEE
jgi:hypothetical protein